MAANKASLGVTVIVAACTFFVWALLNRPSSEPPWPNTIQGLSFSPMQRDNDPAKGLFPTIEEIDTDLALLAGDVENIRTYTVEGVMAEIPRLAAAHGLNVTLGAWIDGRTERNERELKRLINVATENQRTVDRVIVGNEVLLHDLLPIEKVMDYLERVKRSIPTPVSVAEPWHVWLNHPELVDKVDFIAIHLLPYWENIPLDKAVDFAQRRYEQIAEAYPDKPILIGEVGWPSNGRPRGGAVASVSNQAHFLRRILARADEEDWDYFIIEAFDQPWKSTIEGAAGAYWGVYDVDRAPKFSFIQPIVSVPHWHELAAISILMAMITLVLLFRDSHAMSSFGRGFLALITYTATTGAVWLVYDYTRQYMTWGTILLGLVMLVAVLGLILVLLAEAHEWAEALWLKQWRRPFPHRQPAEGVLPFVSIHVPAYNEPPEMLKQTLDALAALDYPQFEVVVLDNNTKEPAVWEPVRDHCEQLGPRFRFFHVAPLEGFKAGALNYALAQTAPEAEVVAVIDSDYIVDHSWLRDLTPAFADPHLAIVQAPQDYRDSNENAFKAMCFAEYRGFFHIGMVTRNERNAIIQHGTMTMVRRSVLEQVGGWGEWCITEDAELGLRVFEHGYEALYVPCSYGKGLIPDNFLNFKKQRFRWAYGAVLIMRRHLGELLGTKPSALTRGQRYHFVAGWLPWMADGLSLVFNMAALAWTLGMVLFPKYVDPPLMIFAVFPLGLFLFKLLKLAFLYHKRVEAGPRQSLGAACAGLALAHTIARAIMTGFVNSRIGFFRTPKLASSSALLQSLMHSREELLLLLAMWLGAYSVMQVQGGDMPDVTLWAVMLMVQSVPYTAAVIMSLVGALPQLPARLVGKTLTEIGGAGTRGSGCPKVKRDRSPSGP